MTEKTRQLKREKLAALLEADAIEDDAARKFKLKKQIEQEMAEIAELEGAAATPSTKAPHIDVSRLLHYSPAHLIGREEDMGVLVEAWAQASTVILGRPRVVSFVALGGEGKTALVAKWLTDLASADWPGAAAVFAWSFYSQGAKDWSAPMRPRRSLLTLLAVLGACQAPTSSSSGFSSTPECTTVPAGSTGDTAGVDSTGPGAGSTSTAAASTSGESGVGETTLPGLDLGTMPDLGDGKPVGCKGKIDLLFVISRTGLMAGRQAQLVKAFPKFIETIESKFDDFDYHLMVIDGDDEWGSETCNEVCPALDCKIGDPCCPGSPGPEWIGKPCCDAAEDYPCGYLDVLPDCETKIGVGTLFPAGTSASNTLCPIDEGRRYMVKGQKDLPDTFACVAQIGSSGEGKLGEALTAAMQKNINGPGGCNDGFLRDDALLMATFIQINPDLGGGNLESDGYAEDWAKAVLDAKHGDPKSVVMLTFANPDWEPGDQIWKMMKMFPYYKVDVAAPDDYSPAFEEATTLVETACAGFVVPG